MPIAWAAGAAVVGAGLSAYGASQQGSAAKSAASQQERAAINQEGLYANMYNASGALTLPTRELGGEAQGELAYLLGLSPSLDISADFSTPQVSVNPDGSTQLGWNGPASGYAWNNTGGGNPNAPGTVPGTSIYGGPAGGGAGPSAGTPGAGPASLGYGSLLNPYNPSTFMLSPDYNFIQQQTLEQAQRAGAASGQIGPVGPSGAAYKGIMNYAEGIASTDYNQAYQNSLATQNQIYSMLTGVANQGNQATASLVNAGTQFGSQAGGAIGAYGNAQAAGTIGQGNATASMYNNIGSGISSLGSLYNGYSQNQNLVNAINNNGVNTSNPYQLANLQNYNANYYGGAGYSPGTMPAGGGYTYNTPGIYTQPNGLMQPTNAPGTN